MIDMQNEFRTWRSGDGGPLLAAAPRIAGLVDVARRAGAHVVFTRQTNLPGRLGDAPPRTLHGPRTHCLRGSRGWRIVPSLAPARADTVVDKHRASAFVGTGLDLGLRRRGIDALVVTGTSTQGCLLYTALHAVDLGYRVVTLKDCASAPTREGHEDGLALLSLYTEMADSDWIRHAWGRRGR